jgi:hypothetical protein
MICNPLEISLSADCKSAGASVGFWSQSLSKALPKGKRAKRKLFKLINYGNN